jgi:hypothetical protein
MVAYFSTHAISKGNRNIKNSNEAFRKEGKFHHIYLINPIFLHWQKAYVSYSHRKPHLICWTRVVILSVTTNRRWWRNPRNIITQEWQTSVFSTQLLAVWGVEGIADKIRFEVTLSCRSCHWKGLRCPRFRHCHQRFGNWIRCFEWVIKKAGEYFHDWNTCCYLKFYHLADSWLCSSISGPDPFQPNINCVSQIHSWEDGVISGNWSIWISLHFSFCSSSCQIQWELWLNFMVAIELVVKSHEKIGSL